MEEGKYIPAIFTLIAGLLTCIISLVVDAPVLQSLIRLLIVVVIFYIIGLVARSIIIRTLKDSTLNESISNEDDGDNSIDEMDQTDQNVDINE